MKKLTKAVLGLVLALVFGTIVGSNAVDASERSVGNIYAGRTVSIQSAINPERVLGLNLSDYTQIILTNKSGHWSESWSKEWNVWYDTIHDAYSFRHLRLVNGQFKVEYLGILDSKDADGNNIVGSIQTDDEGKAQPWRLIPVGSHQNGTIFLFENIIQEGKVLDIPGSEVDKDGSLITYPRHGHPNQQFIIQVLR